ncbi:YpiF family protein [Bacillus sp. V3B]|uniref:YpiF family protein n=1 Tax=Bacillus sp. V3B TaxID=2804915 RepID=UPI00210963E0|nr:YpiF family protein [Bacillus sp. V3B]MCQ6273889.1 YpiF family protein [Bacillus sp. V3B]
MKWNTEDIDVYIKAKEYVDTIVLPLYPISLDDQIKKTAEMTEFITLLSGQLERQFKGRLMMLPGFTYLKSKSEDELYKDLLEWEKEFFENDFKHVYYITSDSDWKKIENNLEGSLIWLPTIPLQQMDEHYRNTILEDQVKQLFSLFVQRWQTGE